MGLFSLLFGASTLLFLERVQTRTERPVRLYLWRNALLLCMGLVHSSLWPGDVLTVYALCAPVLLLFRNRSPRTLFVCGVLCFMVSLAASVAAGLTQDDAAFHAMWEEDLSHPHVEGAILQLVVDAFSRALGMMLIGMGLYRSGWLLRPLDPATLGRHVASAAVGGLLSLGGLLWCASVGFGPIHAVIGNVPNIVATIPMTLGYLGVLMRLDSWATGPWIRRIRALGRMALTNYLSQTLLGLTLGALAPEAWISRTTTWLAVLLIWTVQLYASDAWLQRFRMGPAEWLWRCATYRRWEPLMRRDAS